MRTFPIGVLLESFRCDWHEALKKAAELGLSGVQVYATRGEFAPEVMTKEKRRAFLDEVKSYGLTISALCGDLGKGFGNSELNPSLVEQSKRIVELAKDLETDIVTTHIGVVPEDPAHPRYAVMQAACRELAEFADSMQAHFAVETGPERAVTLKNFLDSLGSKGVSVNLDPANFVMVTGDDPVQAVYTLKDYIVHTHAKDGRKLLDRDPEIVYHMIEDVIQEGQAFEELPLGRGSVDFGEYLKALEDIGYTGYLTIEREVGENPAADIALAADYLRSFFEK